MKQLTYFIKTFGCAANEADSERVETLLKQKGFTEAKNINNADYVVINTCTVRQSAENRVYGIVKNLANKRTKLNKPQKIVLTGCLVGMAVNDKTGKFLTKLKKKLPLVDEFLSIQEVGFDYIPTRRNSKQAFIPISTGCNNFCSYCVVPYTRGREKSRKFSEIIKECETLLKEGYTDITLLGQNVNSYGADFYIHNKLSTKKSGYVSTETPKVTLVKHLGKIRIPTLFPKLLDEIAKMPFKKISFLSSNPWDFSNDLIEVIKNHPNISRELHIPVQSGSNIILKKMNRWYTVAEYKKLISKIRRSIPNVTFTTDIIVGFPGETEKQFEETAKLCSQIKYTKAYVAMYSPRPMTISSKEYKDDVPFKEKKRRWRIIDELINSHT